MVLVGFMGAGKTSVGRALGQRLGWEFEDLDDRIERIEGRTVAQIFRESGEAEFRKAERAALGAVLAELKSGSRKIVALGGGAFAQRANAARLKAAKVPTIFLDAPIDELWQRCRKQAEELQAERPLLASAERFRELNETRRSAYLKAGLRIETGGRAVEAVVNEIVTTLLLEE